MTFVKKTIAAGIVFFGTGLLLFSAPLTSWKPDWEYTEKLNFRVVLSKVRADNWNGNDIAYRGETQFSVQRTESAGAKLTIAVSDLFRLEAPPEFNIDRGEKRPWWDWDYAWTRCKTYFAENDYISNAGIHSDHDTFVLKEEGMNKILGLDAFTAATKQALENTYFFRWQSPEDASSVSVYKNADTDEKPSDVVRDFVKSAVKFNYESLCEGSNGEEFWLVDAAVLSGMVPQSMLHEAGFKGRVLVRRVESAPETRRADPLLEEFDTKIEIYPYPHPKTGDSTNLEFFFKSDKGEDQSVKIRNKEIRRGVFYIDSVLRIIRRAELKIESADFSGKMPKLGDFSEDIKSLSARLNLDFEYTQTAAPISSR